jgi:hypothetical protein
MAVNIVIAAHQGGTGVGVGGSLGGWVGGSTGG